jgi:hypothetical protein
MPGLRPDVTPAVLRAAIANKYGVPFVKPVMVVVVAGALTRLVLFNAPLAGPYDTT